MSQQNHDYLLGTDPGELKRLGFQHTVWTERTRRLWRTAGFGPGQTLIDLGAGPGYASIDLARIVGERGRVIAIEPAPRYLAHLREQAELLDCPQVQVVEATAEDATLAPESADGCFARWLFCFLRDPAAVLERVAPAIRPGGRIAIMDYVNYSALTLAPRSRAFDRIIEGVMASWAASGGDLGIGLRLPELLVRAGFEVASVEVLCYTARPGSLLWDWPRTFFFSYVPKLVAQGFLTAADQKAFEADWIERERAPGTFFLTPPMVGITAVRRR